MVQAQLLSVIMALTKRMMVASCNKEDITSRRHHHLRWDTQVLMLLLLLRLLDTMVISINRHMDILLMVICSISSNLTINHSNQAMCKITILTLNTLEVIKFETCQVQLPLNQWLT